MMEIARSTETERYGMGARPERSSKVPRTACGICEAGSRRILIRI